MSLRISIADDSEDARRILAKLLTMLGHNVVSCAADGAELVGHVLAQQPDLLITDLLMPRLDGLQAIGEIWRQRPVACIVVSGHSDLAHVSRVSSESFELLLKPASAESIQAAIHLATIRFDQLQALRREAADLREALEARKTIERAKQALMLRCQVDEPTAFARLQRAASDQRMKLAEVARQVLLVEGLLDS